MSHGLELVVGRELDQEGGLLLLLELARTSARVVGSSIEKKREKKRVRTRQTRSAHARDRGPRGGRGPGTPRSCLSRSGARTRWSD